jgi:exopolyphosphatase/guanosine-5'-triphosphate,3'-diphosphate pyrophosphatase
MPRYAAIDIGSNSLRLAVAEVESGSPPLLLAADREVNRLGTSVFRDGEVSAEATDRVCRTLERFRAIYQKHGVLSVRAVATSAVRDARNQEQFLQRASEAVGAPVEVISGLEEARLIHAGVQTAWPHTLGTLLIIDIGGGSAEVIVSENGRLQAAVSKPLGAVRLTELFLTNDPPSSQDLDRLNGYIDEKIAAIQKKTGKGPFDRVIATSATGAAVISAVNRIDRRARDIVDRKKATTAQIGRFFRGLCLSTLAERRKIVGIGPKRAEILIGGTAVLYRLLRAFGSRSVYYSQAGVREGVLADLAARRAGEETSRLDKDQRRIVETMARRFGVDVHHARKTADLAAGLFRGLQPLHGLPPSSGRLLEAAAYLSDTGHYVSDMAHHKHSYYLVANADLPAFTAAERTIIAQLCRFHRKSMPSTRHTFFQVLSAAQQKVITLLVPMLRLADSLDRSHDQRVDELAVQLQNGQVVIALQSDSNTNLEIWAAERAGEVFQQIYGKELVLRRRQSR